MKILLLAFLISFQLPALEFKSGEYELVSGDENLCEDGPLIIKKKDLLLGSRLQFPNYKQSEYSFKNDDQSCIYQINNIHTDKSYTQKLNLVCKKSSDNYKSTIEFQYNSPTELKIQMTRKNQTEVCILKFIK